MWIFLKDAFLSVVYKGCNPHEVMVRARVAGDIKRVFPRAKEISGLGTDYPFRAVVTREELAEALTNEVEGIDYSNFKSSVRDSARHDAYMDVWSAMVKLQHGKRRPLKGGTMHDDHADRFFSTSTRKRR
jgi:hypothetical protein